MQPEPCERRAAAAIPAATALTSASGPMKRHGNCTSGSHGSDSQSGVDTRSCGPMKISAAASNPIKKRRPANASAERRAPTHAANTSATGVNAPSVIRESGPARYFIEVAGAEISIVKSGQYTIAGPRLAFHV